MEALQIHPLLAFGSLYYSPPFLGKSPPSMLRRCGAPRGTPKKETVSCATEKEWPGLAGDSRRFFSLGFPVRGPWGGRRRKGAASWQGLFAQALGLFTIAGSSNKNQVEEILV